MGRAKDVALAVGSEEEIAVGGSNGNNWRIRLLRRRALQVMFIEVLQEFWEQPEVSIGIALPISPWSLETHLNRPHEAKPGTKYPRHWAQAAYGRVFCQRAGGSRVETGGTAWLEIPRNRSLPHHTS